VHSPTLLIMATMLMGIVTAVLFGVRRYNRNIPGLTSWSWSYLCGFLLCINLLARPHSPELLNVLINQTLIFLTAYLHLAGSRTFIGKPPHPRLLAGIAALVVIATAIYFTLAVPHPGARFTIGSLVSGILFLLAARTLVRGGANRYPARYFLGITSGVHGVFLLIRPALFGLEPTGVFDAGLRLAISQFVVLEAIMAMVMSAFGVLMLINEHIIIALKRLAERDPLTNVFNRRSFLVLLDKAVSQCQRNHASLPVLVIDLDHFKKINDTWGHRSGDSALSHFVELAAGCLRNSDVIGRLGGEEFAIFLPGTALNDALNVAERLRGLVESRTVSSGSGEIPLTISVGIAMHLRGEAPELTLHRADEAMYQAKRNGRNRVEIAPETITDRATS